MTCYVFIVFFFNDYRLPILSLEKLIGKKKKYKILAVDPHPDDETMLSGGFLTELAIRKDVELKHICFSKGEKGDELLKISETELSKIRVVEYQNALKSLNIDNYAMLDIPDGRFEFNKSRITKLLKTEIDVFQPDLILTYEPAGLYGHPDHIALTDVANKIIKSDYPDLKILYKTLPKHVLKRIKLPYHMANGKEISQAEPRYRLPVGKHILKKYNAAKKHKSQNLGQGKPLLLLMILFNNEYFTDQF